VVNDLPVEKEKTLKCELKLLQVKTDSVYKTSQGTLIAYFRKSFAGKIKTGQTIFLNTQLVTIEAPKNPGEFDYKNYMMNKQITHVCFPDSNSFAILNIESRISPVWYFGLRVKQKILTALKESKLSADAYGICAALLTGYDDEIDRSVMDAFSHSGTLHVLSVSGLHTGLIYLVLSFLFDFIDRKKKKKITRFLFITICLWFFALITGFSAPVLRAVIMFNLLGFGKIFFRNDYRNHINILLASAFTLLCYNPFLITDIGFILSYFALFGILFFQPVFSELWEPENRIAKSLWQNVTASFAATVSTLPFTLFYFKQFPVWFFICNLVVVPATFVILMLALLVVLKMGNIAACINSLIKFLIWFIGLFNFSGLGYIDNIDFSKTDAILLSAFIFIISLTFYKRSYRYVVYLFLLLIFWQTNALIVSWQVKQQNLLTVYHVKKESVFSVKNKIEVYLDSVSDKVFNFHIKPQMISFNYPAIITRKFNYIHSGNKTILVLNKKNFWPEIDKKSVSTLVISNNFRLSSKDLEEFSSLKLLVADGSNNNYILRHLEELCSKFGIEFYSTKHKGAYMTGL
jgi:competence protein ComEC